MKVLISWLKDFVEFDLSAHELAAGLTLQGTEAETVQLFSDFIGKDAKAAKVTGAATAIGENDFEYVIEIGGKTATANSRVKHIPAGFQVVAFEDGGSFDIPSASELGLNQQRFPIVIPEGQTLDGIRADAVIEFETLSNRGDLLSHIGIAREISIMTGSSLKTPIVFEDCGETADETARPIELAAPDLCPRYIGMSFSEVKIEDSPDWMWYRLIAVGKNPISNIVDITNYVLMELGQPLHAFDPGNLDGGIIVRRARDGEKFAAINHNEYLLSAEHLVIADQSKAVAIGGIMGGLESEVSDSTAELFLESAYFAPINIRKSTKKLALMSDSSLRFGRGVDTEGTLRGALRFAQLLHQTGGGKFVPGSFRDADLMDAGIAKIEFPLSIVESFLGIAVEDNEILGLLKAAGFEIEGEPPVVVVKPPSWRGDFSMPEDVSEEVLRLYSYTKVKPEMPVVKMGQGKTARSFSLENRVRDLLVSMSLQEVRTYTLINPEQIRRWLGRSFEDENRSYKKLLGEVVFLDNPDTADMSALRNTLGIGLIEVLTSNRKKHFDKLPAIFEIGRVYEAGAPVEPYAYQMEKGGAEWFETRKLGILVSEDMIAPAFSGPEFAEISPLFTLKAIIARFLSEMGVDARFEVTSDLQPAFLRPDTALCAASGGRKLGIAGLIAGSIDPFGGERGEIAYAELNLDAIMEIPSLLKKIVSPSQFPPVNRDLALVLPLNVPAFDVTESIKSSGGANLDDVAVFDQYTGKNLKPMKLGGMDAAAKNLAFSLKFQRPDRTLTAAEVDGAILSILKNVHSKFGAHLRDYEHVKSDSVFSEPEYWQEIVRLYSSGS